MIDTDDCFDRQSLSYTRQSIGQHQQRIAAQNCANKYTLVATIGP